MLEVGRRQGQLLRIRLRNSSLQPLLLLLLEEGGELLNRSFRTASSLDALLEEAQLELLLLLLLLSRWRWRKRTPSIVQVRNRGSTWNTSLVLLHSRKTHSCLCTSLVPLLLLPDNSSPLSPASNCPAPLLLLDLPPGRTNRIPTCPTFSIRFDHQVASLVLTLLNKQLPVPHP